MSQVMYQYYEAGLNRNRGVINLLTDTFKLALVASTYTPDLDAHTVWADVSANEVANGDGYTTGGATLTGQTLTRSGYLTTFDADDVTFTLLTKIFRYGVLYVSGTKSNPAGGADIVNPLYAYILFDDTPADVEVAGANYVAHWSSLGISAFGPYAEM
jgi:hypothetical protein